MLKSLYHFIYQTSIVWKIALASALSWEVARLIGSSHPYLAPLSVILCLQVTVGESIRYGFQRVLGTIAGVLFTAYLTPYVGMNAWSLGLMILVASLVIKLMGFNKIVINQVALSILLVLSFQTQTSYSVDRIRDTFIGCAIAIFINMILIPPDFTEKAIQEVKTYTEYLANSFKKMGQWLRSGTTVGEEELQVNSGTLLKDLKKTMDQLDQAEQSIRYHPFIKKNRTLLLHYQKQVIYLYQGSAHLSNILQTLSEWMKNEEIAPEERYFWAERMKRIENYFTQWKKGMEQSKPDFDLQSEVIHEMKNWSSDFLLPHSKMAYRFAFALQNDTLNLLHIFEKGSREF
jgi:uncharacterized membrane protein YgaE (UPF0421/DUF939 family)